MATTKKSFGRGLSRRAFFQTAAVVGAAAVGTGGLHARPSNGRQERRPDPDEVQTNIETALSVPRSESSMPGRYPGVVAEVFHPGAVVGEKPREEIAVLMLAESMMLLTGAAKPEEAWSQFFSPSDRVGIKINPIGGKLLSNTHELTGAIVAALESIGVPRGNIVIWDRRQEQMKEVGYTEENYPGITCIGTEYKEGDVWKGEDRLDKDVFYEFDIVGEYSEEVLPYMIHGGTKSYYTNILTQMVDKVINVPVYKNAGGTVTICLKNLAFGVTSNTGRGHQIWNRYISEVCAFPPVRDKVVLNIVDGLRGCYEGGPGAVARYIWNVNTIWAATDPVACDLIGWEKIFAKRVGEGIAAMDEWDGLYARYDKLTRAEKLGLGIAERSKIEHRRKVLAMPEQG